MEIEVEGERRGGRREEEEEGKSVYNVCLRLVAKASSRTVGWLMQEDLGEIQNELDMPQMHFYLNPPIVIHNSEAP